MRRFLNVVLLVPLGLVFIVFAVANRHAVTVSFNPFDTQDPSLGVRLPLFVVIIAVAVLGVAAGGIATWITQRHWRRAARQHEDDAAQARRELANLRAAVSQQTVVTSPALLPRPATFDPAMQDKPRLTL